MILLYGVVLIAGIANAIQPGQTTQLARSLGQPFTAGLVSMVVGTTGMFAVGLLSGHLTLPSLQQASQAPWWAWIGGLVGVGLLFAQLFVARAWSPRSPSTISASSGSRCIPPGRCA